MKKITLASAALLSCPTIGVSCTVGGCLAWENETYTSPAVYQSGTTILVSAAVKNTATGYGWCILLGKDLNE